MNINNDERTLIIPENARSVSHRDLPSIDPIHLQNSCGSSSNRSIGIDPNQPNLDSFPCGSILLFYQYIEPQWTKTEHKRALKKVIEIGLQYNITGRGRVACEGINCTLTGRPDDIRSFCTALREWDNAFLETDFKITDGVERSKMFKSLSIRKAAELVAYGLSGDKAPSLKKFAGTHLEADEYHQAMQDPNTVIIDVRNAYESAIGAFRPPDGGAKLIDPKMRNSIEFPKWLNSKGTQDQLNGKKVLMYCTGGIRCERATALLNQMSAVNQDLKPEGVYHCRGGIERYVKTFPTGGFWKGKNYLFDKRMEQKPDIKNAEAVENDIESKCCLCQIKWTSYRGQFKCNRSLCRVPVIVCDSCTIAAGNNPQRLVCELCRDGYKAPSVIPDLVAMKRKADNIVNCGDGGSELQLHGKSRDDKEDYRKRPKSYYQDRLFLRRLPLTASFTKIKLVLGEQNVKAVGWLTDKKSCGFYGSCIVLIQDESSKKQILERNAAKGGIRIDRHRIKVSEVFVKTPDERLFHDCFHQKEFPPVGI